jgi:transglutaminase/protease-like cytokinesis protein 3
MVSTQKQGQNENTLVVAVKPRTAFPPIGLLDGPGLYTLKIFYSNAMKIADPSYKFIAEAQVQNVDDRDMTNLLPSVLVQSTAPEIVRISDQVTQDKSSTRERAVALHDWVANNVSYDSDSVRTNTTDLLALDALSVLENPWTICEGYSNLFAALTRAAGIRTKLIKGKVFGDGIPTQYSTEELCKDNVEAQANHSWNELLIDGRWVSVDVTWDSGFSRNNTNANFEHTPGKLTYFDQDANEFQKTHLKCSEWNK